MSENPGQVRKIRIIEKTFGKEWRTQFPNKAVDAVYNLAINDNRKSVFCKISPEIKAKLTEMTDHYEITLGELLETMIEDYYGRFQEQRQSLVIDMADDYSGVTN